MIASRPTPAEAGLAQRAATFGFLAALLSSAGQTFFIGLFGASIRAEFMLGEGAFGIVYGTATLASGLLMFWLGGLADRLDPRRSITLSLALLASGALALALGWNITGLVVALFLLRLGGQGLTGHIAIVMAARHGGPRRGRSVALAAFGFIVGEALLPLAVTVALGWLDWRWLWAGLGIFLLVAALPLLRLLAARLPDQADLAFAADEPEAPAGRWPLLRDVRFLAALSVVLVAPFVVTAIFLHQGTLAEARGWRGSEVAAAFFGFAAHQAIATFSAGRLIDRLGCLRLMQLYLLPLGIGVLGLGFLDGPASLWLLFCGLGLTAGANAVVAGAVWVEIFGARRLGMIRGVYAGLMVVATAIAPALLGLALAAQVSIEIMALGTAAWVLAVPPFAAPRLRKSS